MLSMGLTHANGAVETFNCIATNTVLHASAGSENWWQEAVRSGGIVGVCGRMWELYMWWEGVFVYGCGIGL